MKASASRGANTALLLTGIVALATPSMAQMQFDAFVNPDSGTDSATTTGTASDPFETMTFALSSLGAGPSDSVTLHLEEGVYSALDGEQFPIVVSSSLVLTAVNPGTVFIDGIRGSAPSTDGFILTGSQVAANGFRMRSDGTCFEISGDVDDVDFDDLLLTGDGIIDMSTEAGGFDARFKVSNCTFKGDSFGIAANYA
ncbi:MAG: DUF1565 domain-containing protein, partial [Planctomycetota bacterium]